MALKMFTIFKGFHHEIANFQELKDVSPRDLDFTECANSYWLSTTGGTGEPPQAVFPLPLREFCSPPEIWSKNNRKISITIDFVIENLKNSWKKARPLRVQLSIQNRME